MTETEWLACDEPDLMLEELEGKVARGRLVDFVRRCWGRIADYLPAVEAPYTVAEEYAALAPGQSDHDAVVYAAEAALKAAGWAPNMREEQRRQAAILREIVGRPPSS